MLNLRRHYPSLGFQPPRPAHTYETAIEEAWGEDVVSVYQAADAWITNVAMGSSLPLVELKSAVMEIVRSNATRRTSPASVCYEIRAFMVEKGLTLDR